MKKAFLAFSLLLIMQTACENGSSIREDPKSKVLDSIKQENLINQKSDLVLTNLIKIDSLGRKLLEMMTKSDTSNYEMDVDNWLSDTVIFKVKFQSLTTADRQLKIKKWKTMKCKFEESDFIVHAHHSYLYLLDAKNAKYCYEVYNHAYSYFIFMNQRKKITEVQEVIVPRPGKLSVRGIKNC